MGRGSQLAIAAAREAVADAGLDHVNMTLDERRRIAVLLGWIMLPF